jgi:hypothetical protein
MFKARYRDKTGDYKKPMFSLRRYQKTNGEYRMKSKFTISSSSQGQQVVDTLTRWIKAEAEAEAEAEADGKADGKADVR